MLVETKNLQSEKKHKIKSRNRFLGVPFSFENIFFFSNYFRQDLIPSIFCKLSTYVVKCFLNETRGEFPAIIPHDISSAALLIMLFYKSKQQLVSIRSNIVISSWGRNHESESWIFCVSLLYEQTFRHAVLNTASLVLFLL